MKPITDKMVEDLVNKTYKPLADKMSKISEDINKEKNHGLITDSITTTVNSLTDKEIQFIDTEALTDILYHLIFENKFSLKEIAQTETIIGIINESLVTDNEDKMSSEIFISEMTRWLKYHVIPYIYEHKEEYKAEDKEILLKYSNEIAEERNHGGTLEHRHKSNMYWHPVTRVHPHRITKDILPQGHVLNKETEKSFSEKLKDKDVTLQTQFTLYDKKYQLIENLITKNIQASIVSDLFRPMVLNQILYVLISDNNLSLVDIIHNPGHIENIIDSSLIDPYHISESNKKESVTWLRKTLIPKIFDELGIKETTNIYSDNLEIIKETIDIYSVNIDNLNNLKYIDFEKLSNYLLFNHYKINKLIDLLSIEEDSDINRIYNEITPLHVLSDEQEIDIKIWLRSWIIPSINNRINEKIKKEKSPETIISEGFSSIPESVTNKLITKSQITACIFPLNLNYISKKDFEKLPKNIVDILYTYFNDEKDLITGETIEHSNYVYDTLFRTDIENLESSKEFKKNIYQWLDRSVIPNIIQIIKEDKQEDEYVSEIKQLDFTIKEDSPLYKRMNIIVRNFYDSFYTHNSLCLYYTYYILKLKGNTDFDLEFRELEDKLYRDFYNYGIFAIIGELRHFIGVFHYTYNHKEIEIGDYIPYNFTTKQQTKFKSGFKKVVTDISKCVKIDVKDIYKIINIDEIHKNIQSRYNNRNIDNKENLIIRDTEFLYLIEKYFGYYTRPEFILKVAVKAFSITKDNLSTCRWSESYGGEAWGTITRTILHRKTTTSKTIFVDTCWSLQHNTALFINKVYSQDGNQSDNSLSLVKNYLTEIKDGLFKNVYNCAIKYNTKLDRFTYRTLILENDASVQDAKYHEIEQSHKYTEREIHRKDDRNPYEFDDNYEELREKFPEKEGINIVQYNNEDKIKVYKEIDNSFGLIYAKINKLESGWEDNPNIEILINSAPFRWITDLNSFVHYMNDHYPLYENDVIQLAKPNLPPTPLIYSYPEEQAKKEDINIVQYDDEDKYKVYKEIDDSFGTTNAKINKLESGWEDNPNIEILIDSSPFRWITDLNSFDHYMNRNHPFFDIKRKVKEWDALNIGKQTLEEKTEKADILLIISENVKSLENEEMALIIYETVWYHKMAQILQNWIYNLKYTTLDIKKNIDLLIGNSLKHGEPTNNPHETLNDDEYKLIKIWIEDYLIPDLVKGTSLQFGGIGALFG